MNAAFSGFEKTGKRDCAPEPMRGASAAPERIINEAREWIGTPYGHQASVKGVGCDCIGLVRGVWRALSGEDVVPPAYTPDWAEVGGREALLEGLAERFQTVALVEARPGDVLVFRMRPRSPAKHAAILCDGAVDDPRARVIHAYWGHAVVESWLAPVWRKYVVAAFRMPTAVAPSVGCADTSPASRGGE